ncbi:MAG: GNAT family N-acetyltransferase [Nitrospiraceae bacterium]
MGLRWEVTDDHRYAVADLRGGYLAYATAKGSNFRKQARRHAEKMDRAGSWWVDRMDGVPSQNTVSQYARRMFAIAEAGWRAHTRGVEEERLHHPIYRLLLQKFAPRGMADLSILTINGHDAAYTLGLVESGTYYQVAIAYVDEMASLSPGSFLLLEVFRILPDLGVHFVVSHGDYQYKRRWASRIEETKKIIVFAPTVRGALSWFAKFKLQTTWQRFRSQPTGAS